MTPAIDALIKQLDDGNTDNREAAMLALIELGSAAIPALTQALTNATDRARALAAQALAKLADPSSAKTLVAALKDDNAEVRSWAAAGLTNIGDPRALDALMQTLDDYPDMLNSNYTPSTYRLAGLGPEVLPRVVPLLKVDYPATRIKAIWIIRRVTAKMAGQNGDSTALWQSLGSYDPNAPVAERNRAADQWTVWVDAHVPGS